VRKQRALLLKRYHGARSRYRELHHGVYDIYTGMPDDVQQECEQLYDDMQRTKAAYEALLPCVAMSRSPIEPEFTVYGSFDPYGLDGLWWRPDWAGLEPPAPPSLCCLTGAVSFGDKAPDTSALGIFPGPQAPFVIARLLEMDGMVAVVYGG
jgi:hypothetical protein